MTDLDVRELYRRYRRRPPAAARATSEELLQGFAELVALGDLAAADRVADAAFSARESLRLGRIRAWTPIR